MQAPSHTFTLGCALAALGGALPLSAGADESPQTTTYIVTTIAGSARGNIVGHESLSLERSASASRLRLASTDGSILSTPLHVTAAGMIASDSQDGAVTCYNMAMNALTSARQPDTATAAVFVRFGTSVVRIPLAVTATQIHGSVRTTALHGTSAGTFTTGDATVDAGILINATVEDAGGALNGAVFDESQYVESPQHVVARSTCILQRAKPSAVSRA